MTRPCVVLKTTQRCSTVIKTGEKSAQNRPTLPNAAPNCSRVLKSVRMCPKTFKTVQISFTTAQNRLKLLKYGIRGNLHDIPQSFPLQNPTPNPASRQAPETRRQGLLHLRWPYALPLMPKHVIKLPRRCPLQERRDWQAANFSRSLGIHRRIQKALGVVSLPHPVRLPKKINTRPRLQHHTRVAPLMLPISNQQAHGHNNNSKKAPQVSKRAPRGTPTPICNNCRDSPAIALEEPAARRASFHAASSPCPAEHGM